MCGFDPVGSGKREWLLLPRAAVAGWLGPGSVIALCHTLLCYSPYVSNFTVVSCLSFSIWA